MDKNGSLRLLCEAPCILTYSDDEDDFLFDIHQKNRNVETHMGEGKRDGAASKKEMTETESRFSKSVQHLYRLTQAQTRLVTFLPHFLVFVQLLQKGLKVAKAGSQEATTSILAAHLCQYLRQGCGKEDTVLAAAV